MQTGRLLELLQRTAHLALGVSETAGRGLVAKNPIRQGAVVWTESPLVCAEAPQHAGRCCHACLRVFPGGAGVAAACDRPPLQPPLQAHGQAYCSACCADAAAAGFAGVEGAGGANFAALTARCAEQRERFPLLAARLAAVAVAGADPRPLQDLQTLCFANVPAPPPQPWVEVHGLIRAGLQAHVASLAAGSTARRDASERTEAVTLEWVVGLLARLHVNAFRVDCVFPLPGGRSLADVAAAIISGGGEGHSGSALYHLASLFNHSCMPNLDVQFPENSARVTMRAARDIDRGEELCISYIDAELPCAVRQQRLAFAYGFACRCPLCVDQAEDGSLEV